MSECFGVELDDSANTRCIAAVAAASSIPDSITTFKNSEGITYGFTMNQVYQAMLISKNRLGSSECIEVILKLQKRKRMM